MSIAIYKYVYIKLNADGVCVITLFCALFFADAAVFSRF